ncbi:MAG: RluA family pseudouridine synthase [Terrimicrobiaceae bacterium]|nr:RluA family pseudouridine synthase [Terrimicrobiaceae bacterium]
MQSQVFQILPDQAGERLDRFVSAHIEGLSRSRTKALLESGDILRNGAPTRPAEILRAGDELTVNIPAVQPLAALLPEAMTLSVLYEDADLLVLDKPAGLVVHPGAGNATGTLVQGLLHHCRDLSGIGGIERPGIVHRLDKETSGCLVIAKNDLAHHALAAQFAGRSVEKTYLAVVEGTPKRKTGEINEAIDRHAVNRQKMTIAKPGRGREAVTLYRVLAADDGLALIECRPRTGRTHQIRVHLKHLGHPIAGDPVYGRRGRFERHLLHAWRLAFDHPRSGERLTFTAPIPPDFPLVPTAAAAAP